MKTNRRQFLELASTAGAWFPFWKSAAKVQEGSSSDGSVGPANRGRTASATHVPLFDGTSLKGWHVLGPSRWQVENGELLGSCDAAEGGWLELDRGFEDFVLRFAFRSSSGEAGVLLRNAPLTWSRYAHPADRGRIRSLCQARPCESHWTLDHSQCIRKRLRSRARHRGWRYQRRWTNGYR